MISIQKELGNPGKSLDPNIQGLRIGAEFLGCEELGARKKAAIQGAMMALRRARIEYTIVRS